MQKIDYIKNLKNENMIMIGGNFGNCFTYSRHDDIFNCTYSLFWLYIYRDIKGEINEY